LVDPGKVLKIVAAVLALILSGVSRDDAAAKVARDFGVSVSEVKRMVNGRK